MAALASKRREEHVVGSYRVTVFYEDDGRPIGALVESTGARVLRVYIAAREEVRIKLPKRVRQLLRRAGFRVSDA